MINFQNLNIYFNIKHMQPKKKNCLSDCDNLSSNNSNTNNQESINTSELTDSSSNTIIENSNNNNMSQAIYVIKRDGTKEEANPAKCQSRVEKMMNQEPKLTNVSKFEVAQHIIIRIGNNISTHELDEMGASMCASKESIHPDYGSLAVRFIISNHHKNTSPSFSEVVQTLWDFKDYHGNHCPMIAKYYYDLVKKNKGKLNTVLLNNSHKDYNYTYFGFQTLARAYLMKVDNEIKERPQHMLMRVALGIHRDSVKEAIKVYEAMSDGYFTHATPTMFNMGTNREQASSCFLFDMKEDSIEGIYETLKKCALISQSAGGEGISVHKIRAKGTYIKGSGGTSNGLIPMLKNFNETARYVDQGGGRRRGSFAIYIEPWHADIFDFLMLKRNTGAESERARDLFYALWIPDLFMKRVQENGKWTLMCPHKCPGLFNTYGDEFEKIYTKYEEEGRGNKTIEARKLWNTILDSQIETGTPYMLYKDAVNNKNNQANLGTIQSSNLCAEIVEYTSPEETAVCNLASIALPKFVFQPDLKDVFGDKEVTIYSKSNCEPCSKSKQLLTKLGITFKEINLDDKAKMTKFFMELNQTIEEEHEDSDADGEPELVSTVPQIFIGKERIGGYTKLAEKVNPQFDYEKLKEIVKMVVRNLNKIIDYNYYPIPEARNSNIKHRPIGVGVQGLADVFAMMRLPFESQGAREVNKKIFAYMYYAAIESSMEISRKRKKYVQEYKKLKKELERRETELSVAKISKSSKSNKSPKSPKYSKKNEKNEKDETDEKDERDNKRDKEESKEEKKEERENLSNEDIVERMNTLKEQHFIIEEELNLSSQYAGAYSSFMGSPAHQGKLQYDLWGVEPLPELKEDFNKLKKDIEKHGLRNSLCMAMMPTASTSQILGNNECIEPFTSNIYKRRTLAGEFKIINKHLQKDLLDLGLWSVDLKDQIIINNGSIQNIDIIPQEIKDIYKIVWEIKQKAIIDMASDRGAYICQTQSMNLFIAQPTIKKLTSMHFHAWKSGLKTGMYYLRTLGAAQAAKFSIDAEKLKNNSTNISQNEPEECLACGS